MNDKKVLNIKEKNHLIINYNNIKYCKKNKIKIDSSKNKYLIICFIFIYFLYLFSLEGCYEGEDICSTKIIWITSKIVEEIISCLIMEIMLELIIFKIISRLHLIHILIVFPLFFYYSHGVVFDNHGYFNFIYYFILLLLLTIIIYPFCLMLYFIKKHKIKVILIYFLLMVKCFSIIFIVIYIPSNCNEWTFGLNNTAIDNDKKKYGCQIVIPKKCAYKILKFFQDYTKIIKKDCKTYRISNPKKKLLTISHSPYINDKTNRIGFPLTNYDPYCFLDLDGHLSTWNYFYQNLVDMDNKEVLEKHFKEVMPEIVVDFSDNEQGKMIINLNYNQTLSEERKLLEKNANPYSNNILLIYIESVSRANSLRQLKKTMDFIEKFMTYKGGSNKKYPSEIFHSFQFFKYHSFIDFTSGNYPFLFYGQKNKYNNITLITKYLKEIGYITCYSHDTCRIDNTRMHHNLTKEEIYDHQFLQCDPFGDHMSLTTIRCLHGKQNMEHFIEYTSQFWRKYKNNRKYALIITNHGHEGTLSVIKYLDNILYNFINSLFIDNLLKDSSIILLSDHGVGMPSIYYTYDFYTREIDLPMLYLIINDRKNKTYEEQFKYMNKNQQILITPLDIYNTIGNLAFGDNYYDIKNKTEYIDTVKSEYGISLFNRISSKERYPNKYKHLKMSGSVCIKK